MRSFSRKLQGGAIEVELGERRAAAGLCRQRNHAGRSAGELRSGPSGEAASNNCFQATVDFVEPMGAETYFHLQTGAHSIISRSPFGAQQTDAGQRFRFQISAAVAHLFDPVTTHRIV